LASSTTLQPPWNSNSDFIIPARSQLITASLRLTSGLYPWRGRMRLTHPLNKRVTADNAQAPLSPWDHFRGLPVIQLDARPPIALFPAPDAILQVRSLMPEGFRGDLACSGSSLPE